jgi:hypothetical protein
MTDIRIAEMKRHAMRVHKNANAAIAFARTDADEAKLHLTLAMAALFDVRAFAQAIGRVADDVAIELRDVLDEATDAAHNARIAIRTASVLA